MLSWIRRDQARNTQSSREPDARPTDSHPTESPREASAGGGTLLSEAARPLSDDMTSPKASPNIVISASPPTAWVPKRFVTAQAHELVRSVDTDVQPLFAEDHIFARDGEVPFATKNMAPGAIPSADTLPSAPSEGQGSIVPDFDKLFDPFTGIVLGAFPQPTQSSGRAREELWSHLATIRTLQAEIASMHVAMEGTGFAEKSIHTRVRTNRAQMPTGNMDERIDASVSEGEYDAEGKHVDDDEARLREERDKEFDLAESKLDGRKEGIDKIMAKLGELGEALAAFHALETPVVDLGTRPDSSTGQLSASSTFPMSLGPTTALSPQSPTRTHQRSPSSPDSRDYLHDMNLHSLTETGRGT